MRAIASMDGTKAGADYSSLLGIVSEEDCQEGDWLRENPLRVTVVSIDLKHQTLVLEMNPGSPPKVVWSLLLLVLLVFVFFKIYLDSHFPRSLSHDRYFFQRLFRWFLTSM
jgi:hypothetical protein